MQVRFVYTMRIVGGVERVGVVGSTDAFEWVPLVTARELPFGDLVPGALGGLRGTCES
ncbi:MAG: hypothetical protein AB1736_01490 [Chloroflexota bacterium]